MKGKIDDVDKEIKECKKCGDLTKLSCNSIKLGNSRILVLGESSALDGWIKSGQAFYNTDGKLQASGKVLERLLNLCNLSIENINFTEVCKCVILDRKTLKACSQNCKPILFRQLEEFNFDIILPMGKFPTETILGMDIKKLSDVVGKLHKIIVNGHEKIVIPIYHSSPANPLCYKGNENIFKYEQ